MSQLSEHHRCKMTIDTEGPSSAFYPGLTRKAIRRVAGNEVEKLLEDDNIVASWFGFLGHSPYRVAGFQLQFQPTFSQSSSSHFDFE